MNYKRILENYKNELDYLISQKTDPFHITFMAANFGKKHFKKDDMVELRGYYKGLKVAREALEKQESIEWEVCGGADGAERDD